MRIIFKLVHKLCAMEFNLESCIKIYPACLQRSCSTQFSKVEPVCSVSVRMAVLEHHTVIREQHLFRELSDEHTKNYSVPCIKLPHVKQGLKLRIPGRQCD